MRLNRTHKRPLEFSRGPADRDPMFEPVWYDGAVTLSPPTGPILYDDGARLSPPTGPILDTPGPRWDLAPLPPPSKDLQQNDHVMRYWNWRLDRIGTKCNG